MPTPSPSTEPIWYSGVCDRLLAIVEIWLANYEKGEVAATRQRLNDYGVIVDYPTCFAHRVCLRQEQVDHLVRIMNRLRPGTELTREIERMAEAWLKRGVMQPGGTRKLVMVFYKKDVQEIRDILLEAKTGLTPSLDSVERQQKEQGKDLFEV